MIRETAVQFGDGARLVGILTEPTQAPPRAAFGLVTVAFNPKFGPFRVYTQWARRLAAEGIATLRFDLGGIGDSIPARRGLLRERTRAEIGEAVELLASRFVAAPMFLGGICSGAEDAFRYAAGDSRIARVLMVDPFAYRTSGWAWRHQVHRLHRRTRRALLALRGARPGAMLGDGGIITYDQMQADESRDVLRALLARRATVHFIYTSGRRETFNHVAQLAKMFPGIDLADLTTIDLLMSIGHTQVLQYERDILLDVIAGRLATSVAPPAPRPR